MLQEDLIKIYDKQKKCTFENKNVSLYEQTRPKQSKL